MGEEEEPAAVVAQTLPQFPELSAATATSVVITGFLIKSFSASKHVLKGISIAK